MEQFYKNKWFWIIIAVIVIGLSNSNKNNVVNNPTNSIVTTENKEIVNETANNTANNTVPTESTNTVESVIVTDDAQNTNSANEEEYDYTRMVYDTVLSIYPNADITLIADYRTWESTGITYVENSFKLDGVKYYFQGRCGLGEVYYLRVDENVLFNDSDKLWEIMEADG